MTHGAGSPDETLGQAVHGDWLDAKSSEQRFRTVSISRNSPTGWMSALNPWGHKRGVS